jgi:hypothetical protein
MNGRSAQVFCTWTARADFAGDSRDFRFRGVGVAIVFWVIFLALQAVLALIVYVTNGIDTARSDLQATALLLRSRPARRVPCGRGGP